MVRIRDVICLFALLAAAFDSEASAEAVDPNSDLDCAIVFQFFHRMAEARSAAADERADVGDEWLIRRQVGTRTSR